MGARGRRAGRAAASSPSEIAGRPAARRRRRQSLPAGAPLAVVVLHPAGWDAARAGAALAGVAARLGRPRLARAGAAGRSRGGGVAGARPGAAAAPRARGRARHRRARGRGRRPRRRRARVACGGGWGGTGRQGRPEDLVALARQALDAAPAGPPFAGVLLAGRCPRRRPAAGAPAVVARVTGRPPLLAGDPATTAVLGAAALGYAAATSGRRARRGIPRRRRTAATARPGRGPDAPELPGRAAAPPAGSCWGSACWSP